MNGNNRRLKSSRPAERLLPPQENFLVHGVGCKKFWRQELNYIQLVKKDTYLILNCISSMMGRARRDMHKWTNLLYSLSKLAYRRE
jgi:hypothetical protein